MAAVGGRDEESSAAAAEAIGGGAKPTGVEEAAGAGEFIILAVPDKAVAKVAGELAAASAAKKGTTIVHCSGALTSGILSPLKESCVCNIASMHPLQTFPDVAAAVEKLPGTHFFCEGDSDALGKVQTFVEAIGGLYTEIAPGAKGLYHAAAVMACNYLVTLIDTSMSLAHAGGIDKGEFLKALAPIMRATVDNIISHGPQKALTGPVARGDAETVTTHIEAMRQLKDEYGILYRVLGMQTVYVAMQNGYISSETARKMMDALVK